MKISTLLKKTKHGGYRSFIKSALANRVSVKPIEGARSLLRLDYKGRTVFCQGHIPVSKRMGHFTKNKCVTKTILKEIGIQVPRGFVASSYREAKNFLRSSDINYPVIVKPIDGSRATGVSWNIRSDRELTQALSFARSARKKNRDLLEERKYLVEEMFMGEEYRILVFNKRVISVVKKIPAGITGDGKSTIGQLISNFNKTRLKGFKITLDEVAKKTLLDNDLKLSSVLPSNHFLKLRYNLNMSDGGRCIEWTNKMHIHFKKICISSVEAVGGTIGGVDLIALDVSKENNNYVVLEVNPNPYYNMHEKPLVEGKGVDVSRMILKSIFPDLA